MSGFVYILKSSKHGRYYVGSTNDLERRLDEHFRGKSKYTRDSGPYELIFSQSYLSLDDARKIERWIKSQKSRKLIEKIISKREIQKKRVNNKNVLVI